MDRLGNWMITTSGVRYYPLDPRAEDVKIEDIAHSLAKQCRWGGHSKRFYSVAEHSVLVSAKVPREHALTALLHDATEAYLIDLPRPIKAHMPQYKKLELLNWRVIAERFRLPDDLPQCVHDADNAVLLAEANEFFDSSQINLIGVLPSIQPARVSIHYLLPETAKQRFLDRFHDLTSLWPYNKGVA
jgi:5'-deoxynucleotidase YfbR-like HD superfamily hydrolase